MNTDKQVRFSQRVVSWLIISLLVWQPVAPTFAAVITPTGGASMDKAGNGVPVVNIATPNGAGISHNQFHDYNVGSEGLILNNATGQLTQTQLGGFIQNNPNLRAGQEAKGIINEVTGGSQSQLQGYTEVAGKAANVMVANPYGITCNGCGFINTPNATLTTGKPQFDAAGNLSSLDVTKGTITVEGQGLNASGSDALSLISRATEVNAAIHAKYLTVTTGANQVDASGKVTAIAGEGAAPIVAVDTGALGGMYANRIHLVSTEKGVGVNLGNLAARQGDITLDANGKMTVRESIAGGSLTAKGDGVTLTGSHKAGGEISVNSTQDVVLNNATLAADGKMTLSGTGNTAFAGSSLTSGGDMSLGGKQLTSDASTQANAAGRATLNAQTITHQGQLTTGSDAQITADQLDNQGTVAAKGGLTASAGTLNNSGTLQGKTLGITGRGVQNIGTLASDSTLQVDAGSLTSGADSVIRGKGDVTLTAQTTADLSGYMNADGALNVNAATLQTRTNAQLQSGGDMTLAARDSGTLDGTQAAKGAINATAKTLNHSGKSNAAAITLTTADGLTNGGTLVSDSLSVSGSHITNSGLLQGSHAFSVQTDLLDNLAGGTLYSAQNVTLAVPQLNNNGLITTDSALHLHGNQLNNAGEINGVSVFSDYTSLSSSGRLLADNGLILAADSIANSGLLAAKTVDLTASTLANQGSVQGTDALALTGAATISSGTLRSGGTLALNGQTFTNSGNLAATSLLLNLTQQVNNGATGQMAADNDFTLSAPELLNNGLIGAAQLTLNSAATTNSGTLQGSNALAAKGAQFTNQQDGLLLSSGAVTLTHDSLNNRGQIQGGTLDVATGEWLNSGDVLGTNGLNAIVSGRFTNQGNVLSQNQSVIAASELHNDGRLAAKNLSITAPTLTSNGLLQGNYSLALGTQNLFNGSTGQLFSGSALTLNTDRLENQGLLYVKDDFTLRGNTLINSGGLEAGTLDLSSGASLTNSGTMMAHTGATLYGDTLTNSGQVAADNLAVTGSTITNSGLWQGTHGLMLGADMLTTSVNSRTLSGGALTLNVGQLTTQGTLQGGAVAVAADNWTHVGSLVSQGDFTASVSDTLALPGSLVSQGVLGIQTQTLKNDGQLLSAGDITLRGQTLENNGTVQGKTLAVHQNTVSNTGTLTGLESLTLDGQQTLMARMAMAAPQLALTNSATGKLLTQGTLDITAGTVNNGGVWQGNAILLAAQSLDNSGALQSAGALTVTLSGNLTSRTGSKITAMGTAALQALALTNQGAWAAKNLTIQGDSLTSSSAMSGADALMVTLTGAFIQQTGGTLASGGALNLGAASVSNEGMVQGDGITVNTSSLTNSTGGQLLSQQGMTLTTPRLLNNGLIQGAGDTRVDATTQARNDGTLLSGGTLTLTTPQYTGAGWLQATNLTLNATDNSGTGMLLADQMLLTGDTFTSQGTTQANNLVLNYRQLTNNGTLLGNSQLTVNATQINQSAGGKLFSGGDLWVGATGLTALGQMVALGNLTLQLADAFTARTALASGKTLTVSSNGAIDNQSVMQGQAVNITAGGQLSNSGQITTGSGASTLSGSAVVLNSNSALQGGGDVALVSQGNITANGFAGTLGSLTMSAPGSLINTALLYAANNLSLYANSITNQRGNILAGNSLWMQRDAAGNTNAEVINTSGTIETRNGDIAINTGHLLNQRDGLSAQQNVIQNSAITPAPSITVNAEDLPQYGALIKGWTVHTGGGNGPNGSGDNKDYTLYIYAPGAAYTTKDIVASQTQLTVSSTGGIASIYAGRNLTGNLNVLDNLASDIYANGNMILSGSSLNNTSYQAGVLTTSYHYEFVVDPKVVYDSASLVTPPKILGSDEDRTIVIDKGGMDTKDHNRYMNFNYSFSDDNYDYYQNNGQYILTTKDTLITYKLAGQTSVLQNGDIYRSVIQAGGNVAANFSNNISNASITANAGGVANTITAPSLNTLSNQNIGGSVAKQTLVGGPVAVNSPQWQDQLQNALQQINGGTSGSALVNVAAPQKNNSADNLANAGIIPAGLKSTDSGPLNPYKGEAVDTSAYPLPGGNDGYFVVSTNPKSPYLITVNPKLDGLGQLDPALFGDLNKLLGINPAAAPRETSTAYTNETQFLGSSYMLSRLNLNPDYDYRFLGDAAFDTRYVSNVVLNQTGSHYLNGMGSDLAQMQYLMDNAASAQQSLGLSFGVSLTADQIASLDHSILWWESATINDKTVMIPKLYLSPKDVVVNNGSVIAGNNISLDSGNVTNSGSTLLARNNLGVNSSGQITNSNDALLKTGGNVDLSAIGDINNISSTISGKTVALESVEGSINNLTLVDQYALNTKSKSGSVSIKDTTLGSLASINATDGLSLVADKDITFTGAKASAGGALLMDAGSNIAVNAIQKNDAYSQSGFHNLADTSRSTVGYQGSSITAGGNLAMQAGNNLTLSASNVSAGKDAKLSAGNDLNLDAQQTSNVTRSGKSENHSTGVDRTTLSAGDNLLLTAGRDINSQAAGLAAEQQVGMQAGRDVNLLAEATTQGDSYKASKKTVINEQVRQQGTEIASGTDTTIIAGRDMNAEAAQVTAKGDIGVQAGRDVNLTTATESDYHYKEETKTKKGFLSKTTTHTISEQSATRESGTLLSGDNVTVKSGNDLLVKGSSVVGDGDVTLSAAHSVDITAATNTDSNWQFKEKKKSGLMGSGGIGFTIGSSKTRQDLKEKGTTQSQSMGTVGSNGGDVTISAGDALHIGGSDVIAKKELALSGDSVVIDPGHDKRTTDQTFEQKSSGLTIALSGAVGDVVNTAASTAMAAKDQSDGRLAALQGTKAVLSGIQASQASRLAAAKAGTDDATKNGSFGVMVSIGGQSSKSTSHSEQDMAFGSSLNAGDNLSVTANGKGNATNSGDIAVSGSQLKAGKDITLAAARDISLGGAASTQQTTGSNSSKGGSIGVGIVAGKNGAGFMVSASGNASKGNEKGNGTSWNETTLDAGQNVDLTSGRDTLLQGAQVNGDKVTADVGRDLTLSSQQDSNNYNSKQQSISAGLSYTFGGGGPGGSFSYSRDKMDSNYDSVQEQTGIYAGKGGFDITVGNHTQLDGAVIASQADADKNKLDTGTLGFSDINNKADYKTEHQGAGFSTGGSVPGNVLGNMANALLAGAGGKGHAEGTTQSAVADGAIVIRDQVSQQQDVNTLSRDTAHANGSIDQIFDKEKEQRRLQTAQMLSEIGTQVADIVRTQGDISATEAAQKKMSDISGADLDRAKADLQKAGKSLTDENISQQLYQNYYNQALNDSGLGTGGNVQRAITAATAAIQALSGGDIKAALAGAAAPYIANEIAAQIPETDPAGRVLAHAVVNAALAAASGKDATSAAAGAATGELTGIIALEAWGIKDVSQLSEEQKQTVSALATLASGLAGALVGDSGANAIAAAQAGKTTAENNSLGLVARGCAVAAPCRTKVAEQLLEIGAKAGIAGLAGVALKDVADRMTSDELEHLVTLQMMGNDEITGKYLGSLQDKYGSGDAEAPNIGKELTNAEKAELGGAGSGTPGGWEPQDEENARNNTIVAPSKDRLNEAASASNRNGLTDAGRALQKHGGREGSVYSYSSQKASVLNQEAQSIVNEILNNPNTKIESRVVFENKQRITVVEATAPDGRALRFNADGSRLIGFREPPTK